MTFLEFRCRYFFDLKKKMVKHSAIHFLSIYSMAATAAILYMRIAQRGFLSPLRPHRPPDPTFKNFVIVLFACIYKLNICEKEPSLPVCHTQQSLAHTVSASLWCFNIIILIQYVMVYVNVTYERFICCKVRFSLTSNINI